MKRSAVLITIVVVVALIAGAFALTRKSNTVGTKPTTQAPADSTNTSETSDTPAQPTDQQAANLANAEATITYNGSGFSLNKVTVKSGSTITIKNDSTKPLDFASDPHPVHTANAELNVGSVAAGQSKTFTVTKTGTFGYHNHDSPGEKGTITVE